MTKVIIPLEEARKYFFKGKILDFVDKLQSEQDIPEESWIELYAYLETLEKEKLEKTKQFKKFSDASEKLPDCDTLLRLTDEKKQELDEWLVGAKKTIDFVQSTINATNDLIRQHKSMTRDQWLDLGMSIITLMTAVDNYEIINEQLYRANLTNIIDTYGTTRKEAEERAKLTPEYREYKKSRRLKENMERYEMMCKKYSER